MVEYSEWVEAVHKAYQKQGGTYDGDTAARLVELAAEFWEENKEEVLELAFEAAVRLAMDKLDV